MRRVRSLLTTLVLLAVLGSVAYWALHSGDSAEDAPQADSADSGPLSQRDIPVRDEAISESAPAASSNTVSSANPDAVSEGEEPATEDWETRFASNPPADGTGVVAGRVFDADSDHGLAGARVELSPEGGGTVRTSEVTDESGAYRIEGLGSDLYSVHCEKVPPGYPPMDWGEQQIVSVTDGATVSAVDFALRRGVTVRGRVVDTAKRPVADAAVMGKAGYTLSQTVQSGVDGGFVIEGVAPSRLLVLIAEKEGLSSAPLGPVMPGEAGLSDVVLVLDVSGTISGQVVDASGRPVSRVYAVAEPIGDEGWELNRQRSAETDGSGIFKIVGLCPATYGLFVHSGGRGQGDLGIFGDFLMGKGEAPSTDDMVEAVKDAYLAETGAQIPEEHLEGIQRELEGYLQDLPDLLARSDGSQFGEGEHEQTRVDIGPGQAVTGVTLVLAGSDSDGWGVPRVGFAIAGRVIDADGNAVGHASISANGPEHSFTSSDGNGAFRFAGLSEGAYTLSVWHEDFASTDVRGVQAGTEDLEIVMQPHGSISGRVVDARTGKPVKAFEVAFKEGVRTGKDPWETTTQEDFGGHLAQTYHPGAPSNFVRIHNDEGSFTLPRVPPETVTLFVRADGYAIGYASVADVPPGEYLCSVVVKLEPSAGIKGRVMNAARHPIAGAAIFLGVLPGWMLSDSGQAYAHGAIDITADDGTFTVDTIVSEAPKVWAWHADYAPNFAFLPGRGRDIVIVLSAGGIMEGAVSLEGQPLTGGGVSVYEAGGGEEVRFPNEETFSAYVESGSGGTFRISHVPPGEYEVSVFYRGEGDAEQSGYNLTQNAIVEEGMVTTVDLNLSAANELRLSPE
jgi:Carboxypeptidase regulatory-like domain